MVYILYKLEERLLISVWAIYIYLYIFPQNIKAIECPLGLFALNDQVPSGGVSYTQTPIL